VTIGDSWKNLRTFLGDSGSPVLATDHSSTKEGVAGDHRVHLAVGSVVTKADGKTPYTAGQVAIF
jgi:V8-like Glu-specific endopeptidase